MCDTYFLCYSIWSWSLKPKSIIDFCFLPNVFIMKFSSISLITTALAAIASNAITAPGPLRARAPEEVNFLERDLDLYRRLLKPFHQEVHKQTVPFLAESVLVN